MTFYTCEGDELVVFDKCQYMGMTPVQIKGDNNEEQLQCVQQLANSSIAELAKSKKNKELSISKCHITTWGIHCYQQFKTEASPTCIWKGKAKEIFCVVLGRRQKMFSNQFACIFHQSKPNPPNSGTTKHMDAIVIGFYNDKKKQASKFHEVTETMMNQLLFVAMNDMKLKQASPAPSPQKPAAPKEAPRTGERLSDRQGSDVVVGEDTPGYMDIPAGGVVDDDTPGYMDVPTAYMRGREARKSIDLSDEAASDYLCVVVPKTANEAADMFE